MMHSFEYKKTITVAGDFDVIVVGGGTAGVCAAVAAARSETRVALIERYGCVGGNLTVGHVGPILGMVGKGTMRDEMVALLGVSDNDMIGEIGVAHDVELAKRVLSNFIDHENITVYLQTALSDVIMQGNTITGVIVSGKEGLRVLYARVVIDCTGDGDVAFLAGADFRKGRSDDLMQPVTHEFTLRNIDESKALVCIGDVDDVEFNGMRFLDYCKICAENGDIPVQLSAVRLHRTVYPGERRVNTTQVNKIDSTKTSDLFVAEVELRNQIETITNFLRAHLPGYEHCVVTSSGTTVGVRESRRIMGEYILTRDDVTSGKRFEDVVVHKAEFVVDIHNPDGPGQAESEIEYSIPYDIPYRSFVPLHIDGLFTAGRCISGTHEAHASYRIMSVCMAMGQAIGIAAALCVKTQCLPRLLDVRKLQKELEGLGIDLYSR